MTDRIWTIPIFIFLALAVLLPFPRKVTYALVGSAIGFALWVVLMR